MAGWSIFSNGPSLDCVEILRTLRKRGFSLGFVSNGCLDGENSSNTKFRYPFDQIISIFLSRNHHIQPLPAMMGDGQSVDLFRLYCVVRERGGYNSVTENGSWGAVAEVAGLGSGVGSSVKLVYAKYMNALDRWLDGILHEGISGNREESLGVLSLDKLELEVLDWNKGVDPTDVSLEGNQTQDSEITKGRAIDDDDDKIAGLGSSLMNNSFKRSRDEDEIIVVDSSSTSGGDETEASDTSAVNSSSRKRDRNSLFRLLNWVTVIAKNPADPKIGKIREKSRRDACRDKYWVQTLVAREALRLRKQGGLSDERSPLKKKKRIHPSLYDVESNHERLRCSPRLSLCKQSPPSVSSLECADSDLDKSLMPCNTGSAKRVFRTYASLSVEDVVGVFCKDQLKKRIPIGARFQAKVPVWTGPISDASDDSKWLGTQDWPLIMNSVQTLLEEKPTGKGRSNLCACRHPGSIECVKFHVTEKRLFLKYELGPAFHSWKFDGMGEKVSLTWTKNEEKRFKALVRLNPPSLGKSFWDPIYKSFPSRSRQSMVNYYFNVFLLRHRGYQNRTTVKNIDSDDESEFGYLGSSFRHVAGKH